MESGSSGATAAEKYFLDVALPAALTELRGRTFRDTEIIRLQTPQKDQQPGLLYLVYPLWMEGHLDGLLFIGKTAQTGDWTDEMEERLRPFQILVKQVTSTGGCCGIIRCKAGFLMK